LDKCLYCGLPDEVERMDILRTIARKVRLAHDVDLAYICSQTPYYTAADIQALVYNAQLDAVHTSLSHHPLTSKKNKNQNIADHEDEEISYVVLPCPEDSLHHSAESTNTLNQHVRNLHGKWNQTLKNKEEGDLMDGINGGDGGGVPIITAKNIQAALADTRPSVSDADRRRYERMYPLFSHIFLSLLLSVTSYSVLSSSFSFCYVLTE